MEPPLNYTMSRIRDHQKIKRRRKKQQKAILIILSGLLILLLCVAAVLASRSIGKEDTQETSNRHSSDSSTAKKSKDSVDTSNVDVQELVINSNDDFSNEQIALTVSSMGDCTLGTDENFAYSTSLNAYYDQRGADYFFQNVRSILEADDLSIVNMEGTLTESTTRKDKTFAFKAPPEYASILSGSSVEAANLANNHSYDYGDQSYTDTSNTLEEAGITTFGYEHVKILEIKGIKVGLTGIYELAEHLEKKQQVQENIAALKQSGAQLIIVNFHWGIEKEYVPNETQKELARYAVDQGADLVIGHHPHVLQGVEKYKGKYIAYSLGNFCFGGNSNPSDKDTMIFQQTFYFQNGDLTTDDNINIIPCSLSSSSKYNDYCPTPLEGSEKQRVLDKIEKYSAQIQ